MSHYAISTSTTTVSLLKGDEEAERPSLLFCIENKNTITAELGHGDHGTPSPKGKIKGPPEQVGSPGWGNLGAKY